MQNLTSKKNLLTKEATYIEKDKTLEPATIQDKLSEIQQAIKTVDEEIKTLEEKTSQTFYLKNAKKITILPVTNTIDISR